MSVSATDFIAALTVKEDADPTTVYQLTLALWIEQSG